MLRQLLWGVILLFRNAGQRTGNISHNGTPVYNQGFRAAAGMANYAEEDLWVLRIGETRPF